jgi:WD40 repeat protein
MVACDDGKLRAINPGTGEVIMELVGHEDAVAAVAIDKGGDFLVSCGSDCTFRVWG